MSTDALTESERHKFVGSAAAETLPNSTVAIQIMPMYAGTFLVSAATLGIEVSLTRIFSFSIWYHFAYLAINAALLGFCCSGVLGTLYPRAIQRGGARLLCCASLFAAILLAGFLIYVARHPLQPDRLFEQPGRFAEHLAVYYIGIALPFFCAGAAIVSSLALAPRKFGQMYFADLFGAGVGALFSLALMWLWGPPVAAFSCSLLLVGAACCYALGFSRRTHLVLLFACAAAALGLRYATQLEFVPARSTYVGEFEAQPKLFSHLRSKWNAISRVDVYQALDPKSQWSYPQWAYDGKSDSYVVPLDQKPTIYHMFYDAHNRSDIYRFIPGAKDLDFLDHHLLKTPYVVLNNAPKVLVMGSGGGVDVLNAYRNNARSIVAVELQPVVVGLLKNDFGPWLSNLYTREPKIHLVAQEGRNYLKQDHDHYDLIQFVATDTWAAQNTGAYVLTESYLYSQEAIGEYWDHLSDNGLLCLIVWDAIKDQEPLQQPINSKLILQYLNVLEGRHVQSPRSHLAILGKREWYGNMFTVPLLKKSPITQEEMQRLRTFAADNGFQVLYDPFQATPPNVLNRLINSNAQQREQLLSRALYRIAPTTDDNPFFFYIFRWSRIFGIDTSTWTQPITGQLVLLVMLAQSALLGISAIALPILFRRTTGAKTTSGSVSRWRFLLYFLCLGLGYMFVEIAMIQKFIVLLGYPAFAFATIMFSLLTSSGLGSFFSSRVRSDRVLLTCVAILALGIVSYTWLLPAIFQHLLGASMPVRIGCTILLQSPIGFVLGMFMPIGLRKVAESDISLIPWAWAVNGIGSVLSTVIAIILAMTFGFTFVLYLALAVYMIGTASLFGGKLFALQRDRPS